MVEMPDRTAIFDPGAMSEEALDVTKLEYLDDVFITHSHQDHLSLDLLKRLVEKFPDVRITATKEIVKILAEENISAFSEAPEGVAFFDSPHESVEPLFPTPEQKGVHYLGTVTNPGDSHSFNETKDILLMPVTAPWGATVKAINKILELKPKHVIPIHDWHWSDDARTMMYGRIGDVLQKEGISFYKPETGQPFNITVV